MGARPFVHLHVHTQYSLLDGAIRLPDLLSRAEELGMPAVAMTDHGNMFGALDLYTKAKGKPVSAILGCEVYVAPGSRSEKSPKPDTHLVLLARSLDGYRNLSYLVSMGYLEGVGSARPRIDRAILGGRSGGLIGLSGCLGGQVAQSLLHHGPDEALAAACELRDLFERDSFYLEIQDHGFPEQAQVNRILADLGQRAGIPLVATNDAHFLNESDAAAYRVLTCIASGRTLPPDAVVEGPWTQMYLKSGDEMATALREYPRALENTLAIADRCKVEFDLGKTYLPRYEVPGGHDLDTFLVERAREGLEQRLIEAKGSGREVDEAAYRARLAMELDVICRMGFAGYFLIVWDFIRHARQEGIPVGPGRGSGAGSLVAWSLRITNLDPIPYNLLFERFLNPERVSMPDFDIDFCMDRRDEVISYVTKKYGELQVGQIATFHELKSRSCVRDVGRALGFAYAEVDKIAKLVPEPVQGKTTSVKDAVGKEPRLKELYDKDERIKALLDHAIRLEGLNRHAGMHAAGVVIADKPLYEYVPVFRGQNGELVSQFDKDLVEKVGLVKFDFLGLKTLTVIDIAVGRLIRKRPDSRDFDLDALPLDDAETYKLLQSGETTGVFQLESSGMQDLFRKLRPDRFEDIVAAVALYRPGPLETGMVDDYVQRKHGRTRVEYPHPMLEDALRETHGVIVYQEQVMQIARAMAGFTLGQADLLRRAMGKKKPEEMAKQKAVFVEGASARGVAEQKATLVFELLEKFAGYGFNKSHSAAYALISYQTAYLKAHYPVEYMCALLTADKDKTEKVVRSIAEGRSMGITILPPDVNSSGEDFTVVYPPDGSKPAIRFGLGAVKGVGGSALETLFEARRDGPFRDLFDFATRVDVRKVNKGVVEALIWSGAFDGCCRESGVSRAQAHAAIDAALERGRARAKERESGQTSLFGLLDAGAASAGTGRGEYPAVAGWDSKTLLAYERQALGFYITGHPLDRYRAELGRLANATTADLAERDEGSRVVIGGVVEAYRERVAKTGGRMAFLDLEDSSGRVEVIVRTRTFGEVEAVLKSGEPLLVVGTVQVDREREEPEAKVLLESAQLLADAARARARTVHIHLDARRVSDRELKSLRTLLEQHPGRCPVSIHLEVPAATDTVLTLSEDLAVEPAEALLSSLERLFGATVAELR